jgi:hypothetical protein
VSTVTEPFPAIAQMMTTGRRFGGTSVRDIMFSGRIGFVAYQHGLGLTGQTHNSPSENDDHRAAAEAASEILADPAPAKPAGRTRQLFLSLIAAVF